MFSSHSEPFYSSSSDVPLEVALLDLTVQPEADRKNSLGKMVGLNRSEIL